MNPITINQTNMNQPTHFIEVQKGEFSGEIYQSSVFPISILNFCLLSTVNAEYLHTVALFKITPKK